MFPGASSFYHHGSSCLELSKRYVFTPATFKNRVLSKGSLVPLSAAVAENGRGWGNAMNGFKVGGKPGPDEIESELR